MEQNLSKNTLISKAERKANKDQCLTIGDKLKFSLANVEKIARDLQEERKKKNMSMFITIRPIISNKYRDLNHKFSFFKDHEYDLLYGMLVGFHQDGNPKWRMIEINDSITLNLENLDEAKMWVVIRMSPRLQGSPFQSDDILFEVYDPSLIAKSNSNRRRNLMKAFERINGLSPKELLSLARVMNISLYDKITYSEIVDKMSEEAEKNPIGFNNEFDNPSRKIKELIVSASLVIDLDGRPIVEHTTEKGYLYKGVYLGDTINEVISKVTKDTGMQNRIQESLNNFDALMNSMSVKKDNDLKKAISDKKDEQSKIIDELELS